MTRHSDVNMPRLRPFTLSLLALCALAGAAQAAAPSPEPPITATARKATTCGRCTRSIHFRWANLFIEDVAAKRPPTDPLNNMSREVEILFTVRWDGSPAEVTVGESSGVADFDEAAVNAVKASACFPVRPIDVYGRRRGGPLPWVLARDARLCSGGQVRRVEAPLAEALPRLFYQRRIKEALLRAARYTRAGDANAMSTFARAWLVRAAARPGRSTRAPRRRWPVPATRARPTGCAPRSTTRRPSPLPRRRWRRSRSICARRAPASQAGRSRGLMFATRVLQLGGAELPAGIALRRRRWPIS